MSETETTERLTGLQFGDPFTNPWAADDNPLKHGVFVRKGYSKSKINGGTFYEFTDKNGRFWRMNARDVETALEDSK
jgi:hypothetical protein